MKHVCDGALYGCSRVLLRGRKHVFTQKGGSLATPSGRARNTPASWPPIFLLFSPCRPKMVVTRSDDELVAFLSHRSRLIKELLTMPKVTVTAFVGSYL